MKTFFFQAMFFFGVLVFCAAAGISEEARRGNERADVSYAFGMLIADELVETGLEFNYYAFMRGFRDVMENMPTRYSMEDAIAIINAAFNVARFELMERNRLLGEAFLAENAERPGVNVLPSGLQYEILIEGTGEHPGPTDIVRVHYHGTTIDGVVFDTTFDRGIPVEIPLDRVIPGWTEGLQLMNVGSKFMFYIPSALGYGEDGMTDWNGRVIIPPFSTLIFEVELLDLIDTN